MEQELTIIEVASRTGYSIKHIRDELLMGRLRGRKELCTNGARWLVEWASVLERWPQLAEAA